MKSSQKQNKNLSTEPLGAPHIRIFCECVGARTLAEN